MVFSIITEYEHFTLYFAICIQCIKTLYQDSAVLLLKWNVKFTYQRGLWTPEQQSVSFSLFSCKMILMLSLVQEWVDTMNMTLLVQFLEASVHGGTWLQSQSTLSAICLISFAWHSIQGCSHPSSLYTFSYHTLPLHLTSYEYALYTVLCEQPALSAMTAYDLLSARRMSVCVFWTTVKSAFFSMILPVCTEPDRDLW